MFSIETIIDRYVLRFDTGDSLSGSLYLGAGNQTVLDVVLNTLRKSCLWSNDPENKVLESRHAAYKAELLYVAAVEYLTDGSGFPFWLDLITSNSRPIQNDGYPG